MEPGIQTALIDVLSRALKRTRPLEIAGQRTGPSGESFSSVVIDTEEGAFLLKALRPNRPSRAIENALAAEALARKHGIQVPEVPAADSTGQGVGVPFVIQRFWPGEDLGQALDSSSDEALMGCVQELGAALAKLHGIAGTAFRTRVLDGREHGEWKDFLHTQLEKELREASELLDVEFSNRLKAAMAQGIESLPHIWPPSLVHRDLHPRNVLVNQGEFVCLLDFEIAWFADPLWDFARLSDTLLLHRPALRRAFVSGYQRVRSVGQAAGDRLKLYLGFEYLWLVRRCAEDHDATAAAPFLSRLRLWLESPPELDSWF
jgi:Ser/Thr protein kinase RdoA (MazF antagonist)